MTAGVRVSYLGNGVSSIFPRMESGLQLPGTHIIRTPTARHVRNQDPRPFPRWKLGSQLHSHARPQSKAIVLDLPWRMSATVHPCAAADKQVNHLVAQFKSRFERNIVHTVAVAWRAPLCFSPLRPESSSLPIANPTCGAGHPSQVGAAPVVQHGCRLQHRSRIVIRTPQFALPSDIIM